MIPVIGLDVGGANTKGALVGAVQSVPIVSEPFGVWRQPEGMADVIASVVGRLGLGRAPVAMTTTAELVDVFASKPEGVPHVLKAARNALPGRRLRVLTIAGELVARREARRGGCLGRERLALAETVRPSIYNPANADHASVELERFDSDWGQRYPATVPA